MNYGHGEAFVKKQGQIGDKLCFKLCFTALNPDSLSVFGYKTSGTLLRLRATFKNIAGQKAIIIAWTSALPPMRAAGILHLLPGRHAWARRDRAGGCSRHRGCPYRRTINAPHHYLLHCSSPRSRSSTEFFYLKLTFG